MIGEIPFGEITADTELVECLERIYLELHFEGTYVPEEWTHSGLPLLLHVEQDPLGFTYELHGRDKKGTFQKVDITKERAKEILDEENDGKWTYAEIPSEVYFRYAQ